MQRGEYNDLLSSLNRSIASNCVIFQPLLPNFGTGHGIQDVIQFLLTQKSFFGSCVRDLDSNISMFEIFANSFEVRKDEKLKILPLMLADDSLLYYCLHEKLCVTYGAAIDELRHWYKPAMNGLESQLDVNRCALQMNYRPLHTNQRLRCIGSS